jgi:tripartite-type tricarboxylate transporter receptor subunit TctC
MSLRTWFAAAAAAALLMPASARAQADAYPAKPIKIVVGFTAGGTTDIIARLVGQKLSEAWGKPVVIENRPGAGGNLGAHLVAQAPPDGYTLLVGSVGPLAINRSLYRNMPYDSLKAFAPISLLAAVPNLLVVHPSVPARTLPELVALARAQPGKLNFASTGPGTSAHLSGELLKQMAGIDIVHVPYRGAVAVNDLLTGQVQMMFATIPSVIAQVRAGQLRPIAVSSANRSVALPDIPAVRELGYPEFEASSWFAMVGPAGMAPEIVEKIYRETVRILRAPEMFDQLSAQGADPVASSPAELERYMRSETEKWQKAVTAAGVQPE